MAHFAVDIHNIRLTDLVTSARESKTGTRWISLDFGGQVVTLFFETKEDFEEMSRMLLIQIKPAFGEDEDYGERG